MTTADPKEKSDLQFFDPEELREAGLGPLSKDNWFRLRPPKKDPEQPAAPTRTRADDAA